MKEWSELAATWSDDRAGVDVDALMARAHRGKRKMQVQFLMEIVASLAVVLFWVPQLPHANAGVALLGVGSIALVVGWCVLLWRNLKGTWDVGHVVTSYVALERQRIEASLRWVKVIRGALVAMSGLFVVATPFVLRDGWDVYSQQPWRFLVGAGGFFAIVVALWAYANKQERQGLQALADVQRETEDSPTTT